MFPVSAHPTDRIEQSEYLSILSYAPASAVKPFAQQLLAHLGSIEVVSRRTGLATLPGIDEDGGLTEYEALITEVSIHTQNGADGYGMVIGRDERHATAIAIIDAALASDTTGLLTSTITRFVNQQADLLSRAD
ncbi:MAG: hypothetical protein OHK0023_01750 [Anaerolineae bacterium]